VALMMPPPIRTTSACGVLEMKVTISLRLQRLWLSQNIPGQPYY
jgi:hypothetical protein